MSTAPQFPIYIVSKGRADTRFSSRMFERYGVRYHIVVEQQEAEQYRAAVDPALGTVLVLDPAYQRDYDTFDTLGDSKGKGPGPARNFAWDHSMLVHGAAWHWVCDDNVKDFYRLHQNRRIHMDCGVAMRCMEDFCLRYRNVGMAGPQYFMFAPSRGPKSGGVWPAFVTNTRIYSFNLIRNDVPFRWRGRYNEDTDLSLRMLKAKWCTVQFNAFLQHKLPTQTVKGGNTEEFYAREGTLAKSRMQVAMHPDVSRMLWRFNRVHHLVDYRPFRINKLALRDGVVICAGVDDYGLTLQDVQA